MKHLKLYENFSNSFDTWFKNSQVVDDKGDPLVVYHQTNEKFDTFDINRSYTHSFWFTSDKDKITKGETGATNRPGKDVIVMPVYLSIQKMAGWDEYDKYGVGELVQMGYDGIKLDDDYVVFEPNQIKSIDNKTFNPKSDNIYEGISEQDKKSYLGQCDRVRCDSDDNEAKWHVMMKNKKRIPFTKFISSVDIDAILDDDEKPMDMINDSKKQDSSTAAYVSNWGDQEAMFLQTAGFEFIFV